MVDRNDIYCNLINMVQEWKSTMVQETVRCGLQTFVQAAGVTG